MYKLLTLPCVATLAISLSACGKDNVEECTEWAATMECGDFDFATAANCDGMTDLSCDLGDFYTCLGNNFECVKEEADITGWEKCQALRTCD
jgi:hypothetical protein